VNRIADYVWRRRDRRTRVTVVLLIVIGIYTAAIIAITVTGVGQ
jgi:hypothetical protein